MCQTNLWKSIEAKVKEGNLLIIAMRSDNQLIKVSKRLDSFSDVETLINSLEALRNTKFGEPVFKLEEYKY